MHHETGRNDSPPTGVKAAERRVIGQDLGGRRSGFLGTCLFPYPISRVLLAPHLPSPPC